MVLIFPQGEIQSMHNQQIHFEKGIERILKNMEGKIQLAFLANLVDYFSNPKPGIYFYLTEYENLDFNSPDIQKAYNQFYNECIENQKQRNQG